MPEKELTLNFPRRDDSYDYHRVFMPYCLKRLGTNKWVVLNRDYKPLGITTTTRLDYEPFSFELHLNQGSVAKLDGREHEQLTKFVWPHDIFLYDDRSVPTRSAENMDRYLARVRHLMDMQVTGVPR